MAGGHAGERACPSSRFLRCYTSPCSLRLPSKNTYNVRSTAGNATAKMLPKHGRIIQVMNTRYQYSERESRSLTNDMTIMHGWWYRAQSRRRKFIAA